MSDFADSMKGLGPQRLAVIAAVAVGVVGFFLFLITQLTSPNMEILYSRLDRVDAGAVLAELDIMGVRYVAMDEGENTRVSVPRERVAQLRLLLAEKGLPNSGSVGYEVFDRDQGLGTTRAVQNVNAKRALEGELARTLIKMNRVQQAVVLLVLPQRELFSRDIQNASASVQLITRGQLSEEQVGAIQHLVASAVPGLEPERVTVTDQNGTLLARGSGADSAAGQGLTSERLRQRREEQMAREIENHLFRIYGNPAAYSVTVTVDMDFDRITTTSEEFDPESQVVRSSQIREQDSTSAREGGAGAVTAANNIPGAGNLGPVGGENNRQDVTQDNVLEETTNYEINRTQRTHIREAGQIRRVSAALMLDHLAEADPATPDARPVPRPLTAEEKASIENVVKSVINFNAERGDSISLANMAFRLPAAQDMDQASALPLGLEKEDLLRLAELLVLGVMMILVLLLVVRPLLNKAFSGSAQAGHVTREAAGDLPMITDQRAAQGGMAALTGSAGTPMQEISADSATMPALQGGVPHSEIEQMINISQVEGRVRASSLRKIGEIVDKHPEEAVSIIRNWMQQEAG